MGTSSSASANETSGSSSTNSSGTEYVARPAPDHAITWMTQYKFSYKVDTKTLLRLPIMFVYVRIGQSLEL